VCARGAEDDEEEGISVFSVALDEVTMERRKEGSKEGKKRRPHGAWLALWLCVYVHIYE
jgi:hypothetical protein